MVSIYNIKPLFQNLLRPLTQALSRLHITPNQVTLCSIFISFICGCCLFFFASERWPLFLLPLVLFIRMGLNAIDGMLAREHHLQSPLGTYLNELGDVVSDICLYLPFAVLPGISGNLIIAVIILSIISEMTGVMAAQINQPRRYDGPMGKSDRAFVFGLSAILLGLRFTVNLINLILTFVIFLLVTTIFNRIYNALRTTT